MFRSRLLTAASALFLSALPALSLTLECKIPSSNAGGGWITELYILQVDEGSSEAIVSDGLIYYYNDEQPLAAKVTENSAKKLVVSWNLGLSTQGQTTKMQFRATYFKANKSITIRAVPGGGYANDFEGRGTCKEL